MAGKKIDELDPYGSVNFDKRRKDLFEVSKNEGTYAFPLYLPGGSRKIAQEELENMLGYLPLSGQGYEIPKKVINDGVQNGLNFVAAYAAAAAKAVDVLNVVDVYVLAGYYDIQTTIELSPFVNIVGLGSAGDVYFDSNYGQDAIFSIVDTNLPYSISNVTIANNGNPSGFSIKHDDGLTDIGKWDNVILESKTNECDWNGTYNKVTGKVDLVMHGSLGSNCVVSNSKFENKSCGYSEDFGVNIAGIIDNCIGIDKCFGFSESAGYYNVSVGGSIKNTTGRDYCFGATTSTTVNILVSSKLTNCDGRDYCFGATTQATGSINISGDVWNCEANLYSFSYSSNLANRTITGNGIYNCKYGGVSGLVHSSPNGSKWRKTLGNDGEWQTEDLAI